MLLSEFLDGLTLKDLNILSLARQHLHKRMNVGISSFELNGLGELKERVVGYANASVCFTLDYESSRANRMGLRCTQFDRFHNYYDISLLFKPLIKAN